METHTALLLLAAVLCWSCSPGKDCCLSTHNGRIPRRLVESYYLQTVDSGCHIRATVFTTWKGRRLCAPPPENSHWVAKLILFPMMNLYLLFSNNNKKNSNKQWS
uniref:Chemokine interleukin-8-like domain-containing protein n=1 Tax=Denticeps clupeoides TaxID=299321 RepID=A0AAY4BFF4_9TELE